MLERSFIFLIASLALMGIDAFLLHDGTLFLLGVLCFINGGILYYLDYFAK